MSTLQAFGQLVSNIEKYLSVSYSHDFVNMFPLPFALKKTDKPAQSSFISSIFCFQASSNSCQSDKYNPRPNKTERDN